MTAERESLTPSPAPETMSSRRSRSRRQRVGGHRVRCLGVVGHVPPLRRTPDRYRGQAQADERLAQRARPGETEQLGCDIDNGRPAAGALSAALLGEDVELGEASQGRHRRLAGQAEL